MTAKTTDKFEKGLGGLGGRSLASQVSKISPLGSFTAIMTASVDASRKFSKYKNDFLSRCKGKGKKCHYSLTSKI